MKTMEGWLPFSFHMIPPNPPTTPHRTRINHLHPNPGSCVLAITMVNFYHPDLLPERGSGPFPDNDVTKWGKLWWAMHNVIFGCKGPGWAAVGESSPPSSPLSSSFSLSPPPSYSSSS